jgi:hypothetical protein
MLAPTKGKPGPKVTDCSQNGFGRFGQVLPVIPNGFGRFCQNLPKWLWKVLSNASCYAMENF